MAQDKHDVDCQPIFRNLTADDPETTEIESLCMNCYKKGVTRLLLTKIPFYKEVVVMSFSCDECGYRNNEIQSSGQIAEKGVRIKLNVKTVADLNRQVVKSDFASVKIPEVELEIPSQSQKGEVTTVEGIIERSITGLEQDQPTRKVQYPDAAKQIDEFIVKLKDLKNVTSPFILILEDISGNSFIQNPNAPQMDPECSVQQFQRSKDQNHILGIYTSEEIADEPSDSNDGIMKPVKEGDSILEQLDSEILQFPTMCTNCGSPCEVNMKMTNIPHFKEVVIMASNCEKCGHRTNEVKSGGGIEDKGIRIEVSVSGSEDFSRDVLKSETCSLYIPEMQLEVGSRALGGRFSTVEGLITGMRDQLSNESRLFSDSKESDADDKFNRFLSELDEVIKGNRKVTLILDDPAGNSYVQSMTDDGTPDSRLIIEHYERSYEQNDELGLNDMKTENYNNDTNELS